MTLLRKLLRLVRFWGLYTLNFWKANVLIARQVLFPGDDLEAETIELPTSAEHPLEILSLANAITFTPGTLVTEIEPGRTMRVHVLGDPEEARDSIPGELERPILQITRTDD